VLLERIRSSVAEYEAEFASIPEELVLDVLARWPTRSD
jgi:hypothetical protein